jgi:hypothetical protein
MIPLPRPPRFLVFHASSPPTITTITAHHRQPAHTGDQSMEVVRYVSTSTVGPHSCPHHWHYHVPPDDDRLPKLRV